MTWAVLIAVFLFICGFGKFLDDYHLRSSAKSKARDFLIRRFIALEEAHAPDPAATMARAISRLLRRRKVIMGFAFVSVAYVLIILIFYVARQRYGVGFPGSFGQYLVSWMPNNTENILWTAVLAFLLGGGLLSGAIYRCMAPRVAASTKHYVTLLGYVILTVGVLGLGALLYYSMPYIVGIVLILTGATSAKIINTHRGFIALLVSVVLFPVLVISFGLFLLALFRTTIEVIRFVLMGVFDAATDPKTSPFTYTFSLLGSMTLLLGVFKALLGSGAPEGLLRLLIR